MNDRQERICRQSVLMLGDLVYIEQHLPQAYVKLGREAFMPYFEGYSVKTGRGTIVLERTKEYNGMRYSVQIKTDPTSGAVSASIYSPRASMEGWARLTPHASMNDIDPMPSIQTSGGLHPLFDEIEECWSHLTEASKEVEGF